MQPVVIGSVGVFLLLLGFALNLMKVVSEDSVVYLLLNIAGSGLAAAYAWIDHNVPFIVLEFAWGLAAVVRLTLKYTKKLPPKREFS